RLITEGTNDYQDLLKMRIRPKILLAENYEEAINYYKKYKNNLMGVISDIEFFREGELDKEAGLKFCRKIRNELPNLPIVLQSSKKKHRDKARDCDFYFIHKQSHGFLWEIRKWLLGQVGFGDFIFKTEDGKVVGQARDVLEFYNKLSEVPLESLIHHGRNDQFSNWLRARGEFEVADILKPRGVSEFKGEELREFIKKAIKSVVVEQTKGAINDFARENYHPENLFLRLRPGSLGGKGRGIAFLMFLLNSFNLRNEYENISIEIPKTIVIGTDEFEKFMLKNELYDFAVQTDVPDSEIKKRFVEAKLSKSLLADLEFLLKDLKGPLAIRSSSLLEDSAYQPFAGIFKTYMIPNNHPSKMKDLEQLCIAIKLVYASLFFNQSKSYAETISQTVEESKMAVAIQEVVGMTHENRYYPDFSGTASSRNYYPIGDQMKPEDRIAHMALGLGKIIVDGGLAKRFCPKYPKLNYYSTPDMLLENSQNYFYAIDLSAEDFDWSLDDPFVEKCGLDIAIKDKTIHNVADTYDYQSESLQPGYHGEGSPIITFSRQLKYGTFPLADLVNRILTIGEQSMGCPIEIEFAGNFNNKNNGTAEFRILQIRPFLQQEQLQIDNLEVTDSSQILAKSGQVSGNLYRDDIHHILYVKPEDFDKTKTLDMISELDELNKSLMADKIPYILVGLGRWGTSDRLLGIPAKWNHINGAKVMIEAELDNFRVDFSQGSHFFHNIISSNIGYLHIKYKDNFPTLDWEWLAQQPVVKETNYFRLIQTEQPLIVSINAQEEKGLILKPENEVS
ncbi:MAG: histidine kinase, partial [Promethearchaeota archaeon]